MPKINTYQNDLNVNPDDILLGSDADTSTKRTKNFRIAELLDYFSQNRTSSGIAYMFGTDPNKRGYFSANSDILKSVTQLRINAYSKSNTDYTGAFNTFSGQSLYIKIVDINDPSQYAFFDVLQVTKQEKDGFFVMDVNLIGTLGNGKMKDGQSYFLVFAPVQDTPSVTKTSQLENDGEDGENPFISYLDLYTGNAIIRGGYYHVENYDYFVWADRYIINNVTHTNYISQTITLDPSDVDFDRIDVIVINDDETISKITGVPASNPLKPAIDDSTQVEVTFILVKANTVAPDDVENILLYDENLQSIGGESDTSKNSANIDLQNTAAAYSGVRSVRFLNSGRGDTATFTFKNALFRKDFDGLIFFIKLMNNVNHSIHIHFERAMGSTSSDVGGSIILSNGKYGFDRTNTSDWQALVIPVEDFNLTASAYSKLNLRNLRDNASFYVDKIFLQKGTAIPDPQRIYKTSDIPLNDGEDGTSRYTEETDFKTVGGQSIIGSGDIPVGGNNYSEPFANTAAMIADQASQDEQTILVVTDASADTNITFPIGETRLQAYYQFLGVATGDIDDYRLVSAPYGNHSPSELTPDELAGIQNANGLSAANPAATMGDLAPLVTADTGTVITLYPFGNFCNSYVANLEDTAFTFVLTDATNPAGESATVLIKTDGAASDFPVLTDAEYVEGAPFEADAYFDLYAWHNGATVAYTFLKRSVPPEQPASLVIVPDEIGDLSPSDWQQFMPGSVGLGYLNAPDNFSSYTGGRFGYITMSDFSYYKYATEFEILSLSADPIYFQGHPDATEIAGTIGNSIRMQLNSTGVFELKNTSDVVQDSVSGIVVGDVIRIVREIGLVRVYVNDVLGCEWADVSITFTVSESRFRSQSPFELDNIKQLMY